MSIIMDNVLLNILTVFAFAFIPRFLVARKIDMTWDEGTYTFCGISALKNIVERNFRAEAWVLEFHPPGVFYLNGLAYALYVFLTALRKHGTSINIKRINEEGIRNFQGQKALLAIRMPSILLGSLSCVFIYLLTADLFRNDWIGVAAGIILALTPIHIALSSVAMLDVGVSFFYITSIWSLNTFLHDGSMVLIVVSGVLLGFAFASKETGFGLPIVVAGWFLALAGLGRYENLLWTYVTWLSFGGLAFFLIWPWLWRNPFGNLLTVFKATTSKLPSWKGSGNLFYIREMGSTTPAFLFLLYFIGLAIVWGIPNQELNAATLLWSWAALPLLVFVMPFAAKRGGAYEVLFVIPPLTIAASSVPLVIWLISGSNLTYTVISLLIATLVLASFNTYPCYLDYYGFFAKILCNGKRRIAWFGHGMANALQFVDSDAPRGAIVWVFGPKSTAFYHSKRVNLSKSTKGEPLFQVMSSAGLDVQVDPAWLDIRNGDLTFYFPYYYSLDENIRRFASNPPSLVVVYRWATYEEAVDEWIDSQNAKILERIRSNGQLVYTSRIRGFESCWVYRITRNFEIVTF